MQRVTMLHSESNIYHRPVRGVYAYTPKGKFKRLQRLLFWILSKLDCDYQEQFGKVVYTQLDINNVVERIMASSENLQRIYHQRPKYVVVGQDYYRDLMTNEMSPMYLRHPVSADWLNSRSHNMQWQGFEIILVPWIEGLVILPEL